MPCFIWKTWSYDQLWYALPWKNPGEWKKQACHPKCLVSIEQLDLMTSYDALYPDEKTDLMTSYDALYPDEKNWPYDQLWSALPRWKKLIPWPVMMRFTQMKKTDPMTSYDALYQDEKTDLMTSYDALHLDE